MEQLKEDDLAVLRGGRRDMASGGRGVEWERTVGGTARPRVEDRRRRWSVSRSAQVAVGVDG